MKSFAEVSFHNTATCTHPIFLSRSIAHQRIHNLSPSPVSQHSNFYAGQPFSTPHGRATFKQFTSLIHEATRPLVHNPTDCIQNFSYKYLSIMEKYVSLHTLSPDGGIGRRAGLKHQWSNPSRFDPGSGYTKKELSAFIISYLILFLFQFSPRIYHTLLTLINHVCE